MAPSSALPIGSARAVEETQLERMDPTLDAPVYMHSILSVTATRQKEDESVQTDVKINALDEIDRLYQHASIGFVYMYFHFSGT